MAWDKNRPVPWRRLARESAIFLAIGVIATLVLVKHPKAETFVGLVLGIGVYFSLAVALAKFGYERQTYRDLRRQRASTPALDATSPTRARPAPTRRTSSGPSQRPNRKKRR